MDEIASTEPSIEDLPVDPNTPLFRIRAFALLFTTRLASNTAEPDAGGRHRLAGL